MNISLAEKIKGSLNILTDYCVKEGFKGWDPYDGLNSSLFQSVPLLARSRYARLAWIQFFKRSPLNFRTLAGVKKDFNPKALGLFLSGYCNLYKKGHEEEYLEMIGYFSDLIRKKTAVNYRGACWGYNFDWQAKAFFQPANTPTVVATTFIGSALLDAYEITKDESLLALARSACDFIAGDLNRTTDDKGNFAFSYSPLDHTVVFNASLLGSRMLSRVYSFTRETDLIEMARRSVEFCCRYQNDDGSWSYGTLDFHSWVDNFHTGYNIECISEYMNYSGDYGYRDNLAQGFNYYIKTFFTQDGISKYYNNSVYPVDIHSPAQLIITLARLGKLDEFEELVCTVLSWTIDNMQSDKGFFYYQMNRHFSSRIPYMRWAQAWMFYALTTYLLHKDPGNKPEGSEK